MKVVYNQYTTTPTIISPTPNLNNPETNLNTIIRITIAINIVNIVDKLKLITAYFNYIHILYKIYENFNINIQI